MKPIDGDLLCEQIFPLGNKDAADLFRIIQDAPEIRALKFGRWIDLSNDEESGVYMCSCCGSTFVEENRLDNYCRECGAMMNPQYTEPDSCPYSTYYCHSNPKLCDNCIVTQRLESDIENIINDTPTSIISPTKTRNLTDEEFEIYDSWLNSQATKTGENLLDDEVYHYDRLLDDETVMKYI